MPKKEYIERVALIKFAMDYIPNIHGDTTMKSVKRALKAAPAADDVVEVVRCNGCKNGETAEDGAVVCCIVGDFRNPDFFCGYGERKEQT